MSAGTPPAREPGPTDAARVAMALAALSGDEQRVIFGQLCNTLDPGIAVALSSVSNELRTATQGLLPRLQADHEAAAALCLKLHGWSCKELREASDVSWKINGLTAADLALLGKLGSVLPALKELNLFESTKGAAAHDGVQRLVGELRAGALPAVTSLYIGSIYVGDAGASVLATALGRGALPRLEWLSLSSAAISDAALVALAPALRRLPTLDTLILWGNPLGDEGITALVAPSPPAGAPTPAGAPAVAARGLTKLKQLDLDYTQVANAGCAALAAALEGGALPALEEVGLEETPASAAAQAAVEEALPQPQPYSRRWVAAHALA